MEIHFNKFWESASRMVEGFIAKLPSLILAIFVFSLFYILSVIIGRLIRQATRGRRENLGMVFSRLASAASILLGFLVSFSILAPSFQAGDLIKLLGIGSVAIGFAFQNILQNFLAGLLLLWSEPFRVGDEIRIEPYEGTVQEIQARATIIRTYDQRRVVVPNADLFTRSVIVNGANDVRRWEYDLTVTGAQELADIKAQVMAAVKGARDTLQDPPPESLLSDIGDPSTGVVKLKIFWWTKVSNQHQMLMSYDAVLSAIRSAISRSRTSQVTAQNRAA